MEDVLKDYPHLYQFLPDNFVKKAKQKERDVEHSIIVSIKNNSNYLEVLNDRIESLKGTPGENILDRYSSQVDSNKKFHSFLAEMNCYLLLNEIFEDLEPVNEDSFDEGKKPTDFYSEKHEIDIEATSINKHEPESKLFSLIRDWIEGFEESYEVRLIKKDNYNKFPSNYKEIEENSKEVEEVKRLIENTPQPETIETDAFKITVEKSDFEESIFKGSGWESAEFIPEDPSNSIRNQIDSKTDKDPISDHMLIYLDIDGFFQMDHSLTKILQGGITHFEPPIEPEVSKKLNTQPEALRKYMEENGLIPSENQPSAIPPDEEGLFKEIDDSIIGVIAYLPNRKLVFLPNVYSQNQKVTEILNTLEPE